MLPEAFEGFERSIILAIDILSPDPGKNLERKAHPGSEMEMQFELGCVVNHLIVGLAGVLLPFVILGLAPYLKLP